MRLTKKQAEVLYWLRDPSRMDNPIGGMTVGGSEAPKATVKKLQRLGLVEVVPGQYGLSVAKVTSKGRALDLELVMGRGANLHRVEDVGGSLPVLLESLRGNLVESRIKVGRSKSNPGYLSIGIPDRATVKRLAKVFPDMLRSNHIETMLAQDGKVRDSLGVEIEKGGETGDENRWDAYVWYNEKSYRSVGLTVCIVESYDVDSRQYHLKIYVEPAKKLSMFTGEHWLEKFHKPVKQSKAKIIRRVDPRRLVIMGVQEYLNRL